MPDTKASAFTATTALTDDDTIPVIDGQATTPLNRQITTANLRTQLRPFKVTVLNGSGNKTLVNTTAFTAVDATNLGYLTLSLAVGDVVRCTLMGTMFSSNSGLYGGVDFAVDQPTSADTRVHPNNDFGACEVQTTSREPRTVIGYFTATEAGTHGFRPVWRCYNTAHTMTMENAASGDGDVAIVFSVEKLGVPIA